MVPTIRLPGSRLTVPPWVTRTERNELRCLGAPQPWAVLGASTGWPIHFGKSATRLECWQSCWLCRAMLLILHSGAHLNSCVHSPDAGNGRLDVNPRLIVFFKIILHHAKIYEKLCRYLWSGSRLQNNIKSSETNALRSVLPSRNKAIFHCPTPQEATIYRSAVFFS